MAVGIFSFAIGSAAYVVLTILLAAGWRRAKAGAWLVLASFLSAAWAIAATIDAALGGLHPVVVIADALQAGAWVGFLGAVFGAGERGRPLRRVAHLGVAIAGALALMATAGMVGVLPISGDTPFTIWVLGRIVLTVIGLSLVENLFRPLSSDQRWRMKYLCFGLGGIFAYDFLTFAQALLFRTTDTGFEDARGFISALIVPMIAVSAARNQEWAVDVGISRRTVFHTASMMVAGAYLLLMAAAGYYIREFGGEWGSVLQILLLFSAVIVVAMGLSSGELRSRVRVFLSKNFYSYSYDYREIWLGFMSTLSVSGNAERLEDRVLRAVLDVMDCPDGALWLRHSDDLLHMQAVRNTGVWHLPNAVQTVESDTGALARFLRHAAKVVVVDDVASKPDFYDGLTLPEWLVEAKRAWLVLPLLVGERLLGFMVLGRPRAPRTLNWEDYDLLRTLGRQTASYLAEQAAMAALAQAREFEAFNRRFAFVVHDIKNLASQLSLMVGNAEKHGHNAEYRRDMIATIRESADKMTKLLARLHDKAKADAALIRVAPFVRSAIARWDGGPVRLRFDCLTEDLVASADADRLGTAMDHLVKNAIDAVDSTKGTVTVRAEQVGSRAVIEVVDDGPGMTAEFVRDELFRPFRTTKTDGYGIGVFESRELIREMGGELDVITKPERGTIMRISLPLSVGDIAVTISSEQPGSHERG